MTNVFFFFVVFRNCAIGCVRSAFDAPRTRVNERTSYESEPAIRELGIRGVDCMGWGMSLQFFGKVFS